MKVEITTIEEVDLPNYDETVWSGDKSVTRMAPLKGTYCVYLDLDGEKEQLFYQILKEPNKMLVLDDYYEGEREYEKWENFMLIVKNDKDLLRQFENFYHLMCDLIIEEWKGTPHSFPVQFEFAT